MPRKSRLEQMRAEMKDVEYHPPMPPVDEEVEYLLNYFFDVGPVMLTGGSSAVPVSSRELRAWEEGLGIELQPWESRTLRRLSNEYLAQAHAAEKVGCKAPWSGSDEDDSINRRLVARRMREHLSELRRL